MQEYIALLQVARGLLPVVRPEIEALGAEVAPLFDGLSEYLRKNSVTAVTKTFEDFQTAGFNREEALELTKLFTPSLNKLMQQVSAAKTGK
jgi:hypothetical protein